MNDKIQLERPLSDQEHLDMAPEPIEPKIGDVIVYRSPGSYKPQLLTMLVAKITDKSLIGPSYRGRRGLTVAKEAVIATFADGTDAMAACRAANELEAELEARVLEAQEALQRARQAVADATATQRAAGAAFVRRAAEVARG